MVGSGKNKNIPEELDITHVLLFDWSSLDQSYIDNYTPYSAAPRFAVVQGV